ncbi:MAG: hypothetical protein J3Q66DRAFT_396600 [Benniella sp.]|nr:MAG: hypothetical protein J3Q66DRAFT_396600 [Benniella sp.]
MHDTCSQAFRSTTSSSSSDIINIPACHDPTTSQRVVRWKDIQQYFENAQGVMNGKDAVIFLTNNNLEDLIPLRIAHHPGVVLDVVVADSSLGSSSASQTLDSTSMIMGASSLKITEVDDDDQTLGAGPSSEGLSLRDPSPVYSTDSSQYVVLHQESSESNTNRGIHDHLPQLQEYLRLLDQRTLQMQQQIEELQQVQISEQRAQQRTDEVEQRSDNQTQQQQQWQKQADVVLKKMQQLLDNARVEISQCQQDTIYRNSLIHHRIQEHLRVPLEGLSFPMFFMVLPKATGLSDGQKDSTSFRLYFLCEGISYSSTNDAKGASDIHMTNHPGYDIKNPKEFFGKYGSYILTTMYMIKHGAIGPEFVVPPLAHSKLVARIEEKQEYLASIKKNISRLIDMAISYLEGTSTIDSEIKTSHWTSALADKAELRSYLDNIDDDYFPGDLHQLVIQGSHCSSWMCGAHHHERIIRHLKDVVNAIGGKYSEDSKMITVYCDTVEERLYDAMTEFCKAQTTDDPSLSADIGQLSLTASTSQAGQEISVKIDRLGDLTMDGVKFIQHCTLTKLTIRYTPKDSDEDRLVGILNQCHELKELHIRCNGERSYAIIHLVTSTRETAIQEGRISALHTFKVTDERWDPFDWYRSYDGYDHLVTTVTFTKDPVVFDMDTQIKMQGQQPVMEGSPISNFMRHYGWSISSLATSMRITDHLATLLDNATKKQGSRLTHLILSPFSLTTLGMDIMDQVIKRSQRLVLLWLYCTMLERAHQSGNALLLLGRYGERLSRLTLDSLSMEKWLPQFTQVLPTTNNLPRLDVLHMRCYRKSQVPHEFIQWLVDVVPDLLQPSESRSSEGSRTGTSQQAMKTSTVLARLVNLRMCNVILRPQDWETLIKAFDLTVLRELDLGNTNFSSEQLDLLLDRIAATDAYSVSLKILHLGYSELLVNADKPALKARILKVAPQMTINGL